MELNTKIQIKLLNVKNPQCFWFRTMSAANLIETKLKKYLEKQNTSEIYVPEIGGLVIAYAYNRYSVVRVTKILDENEIIFSILENGHKRRDSINNIIQLNDTSLAELAINSILTGSLSDVQPAKELFNHESTSPVIKKINKWSSESIERFRNRISKSSAVYFEATHKNNSCYKGKLTTEMDISQALIEWKNAISIDDIANNANEPGFLLGEDLSDDVSDTQPIISIRNGNTSTDTSKSSQSLNTNVMHETSEATGVSTEMSRVSTEWSESSQISSSMSQLSEVPIQLTDNLIEEVVEYSHEHCSSQTLITTLSPIAERSQEDDEVTMTSCVTAVCSDIHSYLMENSETEDEPEQYEYTWSRKLEIERSIQASNALKRKLIDSLLQHATLVEDEPFVYSKLMNDPDNNLPYCIPYKNALKELNKVYRVQEIIWPYIKSGRSTILMGNTDFYPHLLYLPPILNMIKMLEDLTKPKIEGPKVVIFASNCKEAREIRQICSCFLSDSSVYTDAEDYIIEFNERKYEKCDIYVSLMSRISHNPEKHFPKTTQRIVLNNFDAVPSEKRVMIVNSLLNLDINVLVTSQHYVEELRILFDRIPNMLVSIESHFDLFYFASKEKGSHSTEIHFFENKLKEKLPKLKRKLIDLLREKVVIVCSSAKKAENLSNLLRTDYEIETVVNKKPQKGSPKILICSDDQLMTFDVKNANHIINYDLPNDFDTFCRRYKLLSSSFNFDPKIKPLSFIFATLGRSSDERLVKWLLFREYNIFFIPPRFKKILFEKIREMNMGSPLCMNIATAFNDVCHMLQCSNRHFFDGNAKSVGSLFNESKTCHIQMLEVFTPACFSVRLLKSRAGETNVWQQHFSPDLFQQFKDEFKEFYANNFKPIQDSITLQDDALYVLRDGNDFFRCRVLVTSIDGTQVRVRLVDFGQFRVANASNIGSMQPQHMQFPLQSTNLCLLNVLPWNKLQWDDYDTEYASNKLLGWNQSKTFETIILWEVQPDVLFALNLFVSDDLVEQNGNYVDFMTQKGIAIVNNNINDFDDFFKHAIKQNVLTEDQRNTIEQFLQ